MSKYNFSAYALTKEFDLNTIARHYNIDKKFKWEDSLILDSKHFTDVIDSTEKKIVYIYSFGSMVFINFTSSEMSLIMKYFETNFNLTKNAFSLKYLDEYNLEILEGSEFSISNDYAICPSEKSEYFEIISLILARSVALDKIENGISILMDEVEDIIDFLEKGKLSIKDKSLSKLASRILGFKYTSISYIMIFDKPDITWENIEIDDFYYELSELFELEDRFSQMRDKLEVLMDITEVFTNLAHDQRSTRLEWIIIILIAVEFIVALVELSLRVV